MGGEGDPGTGCGCSQGRRAWRESPGASGAGGSSPRGSGGRVGEGGCACKDSKDGEGRGLEATLHLMHLAKTPPTYAPTLGWVLPLSS